MDGGMLFHRVVYIVTRQNYSTHLPGVSLLLLIGFEEAKLPNGGYLSWGPHDRRSTTGNFRQLTASKVTV